MRLLQVNDPHLSDKPPLRRTPQYLEELFEKLYEIKGMADQYNVDALVIPGDLFHQKTAMRVSYFLTMRVLKWVADVDRPIFILPGNHDLTDNNLASLSRQPIGTLHFMPNVTFLGQYDVGFNGYHLWGVPGVMTDFTVDRFMPKTPWQQTIIVAHGPIVVDDKNYPYEVLRAKDIAGTAFLLLYGHFHTPIETTKIGNTTFVNPGALSRGTIGEDDLKRTPQIAIIDIDDAGAGVVTSVKYVPLRSAKPIEEVFLLEQLGKEKEHSLSVEEFLTNLVGAKVTVVSRESLSKAIDESEAPFEIRSLAKAVLEETN